LSDTSANPALRRIGAIDVGTNSIRLIIAEAGPDGAYRILDDEKETTRLGRGLEATGQIDAAALEESAQAVGRMKSIAEGFGVERLRVIGTCAVREAANRDELLARVRDRAGLSIEPISAEEEAELAHLSVAHAFDLSSLAVAVVDIGGGSTEIIFSSGGVVEQVYSLPLGAVRLTERFGGAERFTGGGYRKMRRAIARLLHQTIGPPPFFPQLLIGTGGTFTSLANISRARSHSGNGSRLSPSSVRGYEMKRPEVRHLVDWLRKLPLRARTRVSGLSPDRADIIVAGVAIVEGVLKYLGVNRLLVHDGGVRDGLLLTMAGALFPRNGRAAPEPPDRMRSVRQFAAACGYEEAHCDHVAGLAGQVFDQLAERFPSAPGGWSDPVHRPLLEAAALLRDVGYLINYSKHHLHSYHLILHSGLSGFTPREIGLVANIARYHRRAQPKVKHPNFTALSKSDRKLVRHLAAILRVADGLDRTRMQVVRGVRLRFERGAITFVLEAAEDPAVDAWGALRKSRLFQNVFGVKVHYEWGTPAAVAPRASGAVVNGSMAAWTGQG
jgi:exopolyphosphatase/guanosine-5'-triphosphate,3'-diphosphate pyrophosphatase